VTIVPFQRDANNEVGSVLLTIEDLTQSEQLRRLELEASNLRMVKNMAHRLVAETGNAIVPLNTFVQIPPDAIDRNLLLSMLPALKETDKRIERRVKQFRYLAEDILETSESLTLNSLLEKAFAEAQHYHPARNAQFVLENTGTTAAIQANRERLTFAIAEIFMNALLANPNHPSVVVRRLEATGRLGGPMLAFEIQDNGPGFAPEAFEKVGKHFFTTRIPGLGLGLAVARKIIEAHGGTLEISAPGASPHGVVRVSLPLTVPVEAKVH
jgi:signal transduction histidine kinase